MEDDDPHHHHPSSSSVALASHCHGPSSDVAQLQQHHHALSLSLPVHLASSVPANLAPKSLPNGLDHSLLLRHPLPSERPSRDDCWSEGATNMLIDVWGDRYLELNRGNLKQKHWKDVADSVNAREDGVKPRKTDVQCKNRLDTLKKKYKLEKSKIVTGGGPSKWPFYERLDELIGPSKKPRKPTPIKARPNDKRHAEEGDEKRVFNSDAFLNNATAVPNNTINHIPDNNANIIDNNITTTDTLSKSKGSPVMTDSCLDGRINAMEDNPSKKRRLFDSPFKDLARAILKFGEVYERIESAKQQQMMDLERQRMEFTKDLELQRMQLFMQTQVELAKLKHGKRGSTEHYL